MPFWGVLALLTGLLDLKDIKFPPKLFSINWSVKTLWNEYILQALLNPSKIYYEKWS